MYRYRSLPLDHPLKGTLKFCTFGQNTMTYRNNPQIFLFMKNDIENNECIMMMIYTNLVA